MRTGQTTMKILKQLGICLLAFALVMGLLPQKAFAMEVTMPIANISFDIQVPRDNKQYSKASIKLGQTILFPVDVRPSSNG